MNTIKLFVLTFQDNGTGRVSLFVNCVFTFVELLLLLFIHYLQLGRHPVAAVVTCYISTDYEDFTLTF